MRRTIAPAALLTVAALGMGSLSVAPAGARSIEEGTRQ